MKKSYLNECAGTDCKRRIVAFTTNLALCHLHSKMFEPHNFKKHIEIKGVRL